MKTTRIPKSKFEQPPRKIETLKNTGIYRRLLKFETNIQQQKFTRKDLGF